MLLAAMVAMVLALAAPAMAQDTEDSNNIEDSNVNTSENNNLIAQQCVGDVTQNQANVAVQGDVSQAQTPTNVALLGTAGQVATQTVDNDIDQDNTAVVVADCEQYAANVNVTNQYAGDIFGVFAKWFD